MTVPPLTVLQVEKTDSASHNVDEAHIIEDGHIDPALVIDPVEERQLLRKIDLYLMTIFGALYLMCFLDRGNIGSANVATPSISQSLGLSAQQYGAVVSVVYATYVVFEPMWANLLKILSPRYVCMSSLSSAYTHIRWLTNSERLYRCVGYFDPLHCLGQGLQPHDRDPMSLGLFRG